MTPRTVIPLVLAAVLATGCSSVEFWKDQFSVPAPPPQAGQAGGAEARAQPAKTAEAHPQTLQTTEALGHSFQEDIELARTLAEQFWQQQFQASGKTYRPLQKFVAYKGEDGPSCGGRPAVPENAFYCPVGHFVAYDETWMRSLYKSGDGSVYVIIPHEIGHAVQAQLMRDFNFNVTRELQADCYAGGALKGMIDAKQLEAESGDEKELLSNLAAAGDPTDAWWREDAHGTPIQRQRSFTKGFNDGADAC